MTNRLASILDAYDEHLVEAVDEQGHLRVEVAKRMLETAQSLLAGVATPEAVEESWGGWFTLADVFADFYGLDELRDAQARAEMGREAPFPTIADRRYLESLDLWLSAYIGNRALGMLDF